MLQCETSPETRFQSTYAVDAGLEPLIAWFSHYLVNQ